MSKVFIRMTAQELNKFIGGSTEAALELKGGIVQNFAKKYLKSLVTDELRAVGDVIKKEVVGLAADSLGKLTTDYYGKVVGITLHDHIEKAITQKANMAVMRSFDKLLTNATDEACKAIMPEAEDRLKANLLYNVTKVLQSKLAAELSIIVSSAFKRIQEEEQAAEVE